MKQFIEEDEKNFSDKLLKVMNKITAGHMKEPENINEEKAKRFENWTKRKYKELNYNKKN